MVLDLRFIPDSMGFARAPRDEAREVPPKYKLPSFAASALQSSTVTPTWDADDHERKQAMQRNFKKSELREVPPHRAHSAAPPRRPCRAALIPQPSPLQIDYAAYLASDSDEDGGVEEYPFVDAPLAPPREKSRATLQALRGDAGDEGGDDADDEGGDGLTHELTYLPGLEGRAREKARRRELGLPDAAAPSVFELEEQKRREKAKQRKQQRLAARNGGSAAAAAGGTGGTARGAEEDEMPAGVEDDPFFAEAMAERDEEEERAARPQKQKRAAAAAAGAPSGAVAGSSSSADAGGGGAARKGRKGKKGRPALSAEEREEEARRAAELELLVMDGDDDPRGFDAKRLELPAGGRGLKGKKRAREAAAAAAAASAADDGFQLDTADPRFQQLYNSHEYAIDPTHPKFKRTVASEQLMAEVSRRHVAEPPKAEPQRPRSSDPALAKLVSSLKSKASSKAKAKPAKAAQRPPKRALSS